MSPVEAALAAAEGEGLVPGFVATLRRGGETMVFAHGRRSLTDPAPMTPDTVFWIASCTKLVTSIVALQLIEEGVLELDQPVASLRPDFADLPILDGFDAAGEPVLRPAPDTPTIRHLLTHTSGLGYLFMDADLARYAQQAGVDSADAHLLPRRFEAGERWLYGASTDWLGAVIEAATGETLDEVFQRRVLDPLGMTDTVFAVGPAHAARQASMHARLPDGGLAPMVFAMPPPPYFSMGGGGVYSTAADFMALLCALLDGTLLGEASRAALFTNQIGELEAGVIVSSVAQFTNDFDPLPGHAKRWSLGLLLNAHDVPGARSGGSGAWAGLGNCYYWIDPASGVAGLLLCQVLPFADERALRLFSIFERAAYA